MRTASISSKLKPGALALAVLGLCQGAWAQVPGSDPIVIGGQVSYLTLPTAPVTASKPLDQTAELPSWVQAKVSRYEAKAFSAMGGESGTIKTGDDVISVQRGNALQRTCSTNVASNVGATAAGAGRTGSAADQIAVLRGDVITICK